MRIVFSDMLNINFEKSVGSSKVSCIYSKGASQYWTKPNKEPFISEKVTHFVWCALIAVEIARSDGRIQTQEEERIFIKKWLQEEKKEKRFCQDISPVLLALLKLNKLYGASISIREILNYYWLPGTESQRKQTDFYRLHCALTLIQFPAAKNSAFLRINKLVIQIYHSTRI